MNKPKMVVEYTPEQTEALTALHQHLAEAHKLARKAVVFSLTTKLVTATGFSLEEIYRRKEDKSPPPIKYVPVVQKPKGKLLAKPLR